MTSNMLASMFALLFAVSFMAVLLLVLNHSKYGNSSEWVTSFACVLLGLCALVSLLFIGALFDVYPGYRPSDAGSRRSSCVACPQGTPERQGVPEQGQQPKAQFYQT